MRRRHLETEHRYAVLAEVGVPHRPGQRDTAEHPDCQALDHQQHTPQPEDDIARGKTLEGIVYRGDGYARGLPHAQASDIAHVTSLP
jgi:hypothetical protein